MSGKFAVVRSTNIWQYEFDCFELLEAFVRQPKHEKPNDCENADVDKDRANDDAGVFKDVNKDAFDLGSLLLKPDYDDDWFNSLCDVCVPVPDSTNCHVDQAH